MAVYTWLMNLRSQVKLSTFFIMPGTSVVNHNYVVIHDAPPKVVKEITDRFVMVSLRPEGMIIPLTPDSR